MTTTEQTEPTMPQGVAYTALCVWEAMLDPEFDEARQSYGGAHTCRELALTLAPLVDASWHSLTEAERLELDCYCYDWDYVPCAMRLLARVDWNRWDAYSAKTLGLDVLVCFQRIAPSPDIGTIGREAQPNDLEAGQ